MERWEKIAAVQKMQDYIKVHIDEAFNIEEIAKASNCSLYLRGFLFVVSK